MYPCAQKQEPSGTYTSKTNYVTHFDANGTVTTGSNSLPLNNITRTVTGNQPEQVPVSTTTLLGSPSLAKCDN